MDANAQKIDKLRKVAPPSHIKEPISLDEALNLFLSCNFDAYIQEKQIIEIHFEINDELEDQDIEILLDPQIIAKMSAIITFQSTIDDESRTFWKTVNQEHFYLLQTYDCADGYLTKHCHNFLVKKLQNEETGTLKEMEDTNFFTPFDIGNNDGYNLLAIAVIENNDEAFKKLLSCDFDAGFKISDKADSKKMVSLIDVAWRCYTNSQDEDVKISSNKIILQLLEADSKFPKEFNYEVASTEVQQLVNNRDKLHEYIKLKNYKALEDKITSESSKLIYYYDRTNQSLLMRAFTMIIDSDTFEILSKLGLKVGDHENNKSKVFCRQIRNKNRSNAKDLPKAHVVMLEAKSKIPDYNHQNPDYSKHILEAYKTFDENESCSNVLKVVAACNKLKIFFDFKHDTAFYFDPTKSIRTSAVAYSTGEIHIGAKDLLSEQERYEVLGVTIHEFGHLAILMTFMNNFDPYQMGESKDKTRFIEKVVKECKKNQGIEGMIDNVFDSYPSEEIHSEIIVLVCQMLMHYFVKDPKINCKNSQAITKQKEIFSELFKYFKEVVEPELIKVLPVLKKLQDDDQNVEYNELTEPMKAKILNKKINFQGKSVSILEIIENDESILNLLTSNDIKRILLNGEEYKIGETFEQNNKYEYVKRSFNRFIEDKFNQNQTNSIEEFKNIDQIINEVEDSKIFILAAKAGEGKTATFENITKTLKEKNNNFWVSFIKLRDFREVINAINIEEIKEISNIFEIFVNIIFPISSEPNFDINSKFEIKIFKKLFDTGKVILLLDGIDEVCPKFNQHIITILSIFRKDSNNQLWVSTRPQHVDQITETLGTKAFTLKPYNDDERNQLIFEICKELKKNYNYFHSQLFWFFKSYIDYNNPLLIIIITEMYINGTIVLKNESYDYFKIYELLVDEQFDKIDLNVDKNDKKRSLNFPLLHQVLALKFMFEEEQIENLQIMDDWKTEKNNWTAEKIQRFGFVVVDLKFLENNNKSSIDFIHYSIAEFFVSQYIVENIFKNDKNYEEIELLFKLIKLFKLKNSRFLLNYIKNHWDVSVKKINIKLTEMIVNEIEKCSKINVKYGDLDCLHFWCPFLKNKPELLRSIWQVNQKKTLFNKILFSFELFRPICNTNILEFVFDCLGDNWHEILNNSGEKLDIDDITDEISVNEFFYFQFLKEKRFFKNFYKLLIFVEKTFNAKERKMFALIINSFLNNNFNALHGNYYEKCFEQILKSHEINEEIVAHIVINIIAGVDCKKLDLFQKLLENFYKNDREKIGDVLFFENVVHAVTNRLKNTLSVKDIRGEFPKKFKIFFNVYEKFKNSWEEVQLIFLYEENIFELLKEMPTEFIPEFLDCMKLVFGSSNENFFKFVNNKHCVFTTELLLVLENFLAKYFDEDESLVRKGMRGLLYSDDKRSLYYPADNLEKFITLRRKYQNSNEEFQENLRSWEVLSKLFLLMPIKSFDIFKQLVEEIFFSNKHDLFESIQDNHWNSSIIESKEKFPLIEQFFNEFFCDCEEDARKCLRKLILNHNNILIILTNKLNNENEFERVKNIYFKYLTKEEIRNDFVSKNNLFFTFIKNYSLECHSKFVEFAKEIFNEKNEKLFLFDFNSSDSYNAMNLVQNDSNFKFFERFLVEFYENDENQVRNTVRAILFNQNFIKRQLFLKSTGKYYMSPKFQYIRDIYIKYKNSWEEVQNIFTSLQDLGEIFTHVDNSTFPLLQEFLIEVFESNKSLLFICFNYEKCESLVKKPQNLKLLEFFLQKFTNNNEYQVKDCMHKILIYEIKDNFNPLAVFVQTENPAQLEYLITTYKKYKNSWEELQNLFISKPLSNLFFRQLSDKTYPIIEDFIREIFDSNKSQLKEIELIYETMKFDDVEYEDYFYDEENEKYFIKKFEEFRNTVNL